MPRKSKQPPTIRYAPLDPKRVDGLCYPDGAIVLSASLRPKRKLIVAIHEFLHYQMWSKPEAQVTKEAEAMGEFLWFNGFRLTVKPNKKK